MVVRHLRKSSTISIAALVVLVITLSFSAHGQGRQAAIWGTVKDAATQRPLAAHVSIVHLDERHIQFFHARTDANGWYESQSLPPGNKVLIAGAEDFGFAVKEVSVEAEQLVGPINFELEEAAKIAGSVVDEQTLPVQGATVRAVYPDAPRVMFGWQMSEAVTDEAGRFYLRRVTPNSDFYLEASHDEFPVRFSDLPFQLAAGEEHLGAQLRLRHGVRVSGLVVDSAGAPIEGAEVRLMAKQLPVADPTLGRSHGLRQETHRKTVTDAQGRFIFKGLGNGTRVLIVRYPNYEMKQQRLRLDSAVAATMEVRVTITPSTK